MEATNGRGVDVAFEAAWAGIAVQQAADMADWYSLRFLSHKLKGSSASIGAYDLMRRAEQIENACKDGVPALLIEDIGTSSRTGVRHQAPRTLVLSHVRCGYSNQNRQLGAKLFLNNGNGMGNGIPFRTYGQTV